VEVTGPLSVVLYVSSSAPDTDFTAKLVDVYPDGSAFNIQESILRARYREGFDKKVWMKPGEVYEVKIDLQATSNYFGPGHRIRLEISSSNTGGNQCNETEWKVATNTIHHSRIHPSHIVLPVIPSLRISASSALNTRKRNSNAEIHRATQRTQR
jgi:putative CocE/NonD family hydrolase